MPYIALGNAPVANLKVGTVQAQKAYLGTTQVWSAAYVWPTSEATISFTARSSTWGPALVPSGRVAHWDASHEASMSYWAGTVDTVQQMADLSGNGWWLKADAIAYAPRRIIGYNNLPVLNFEGADWMVHWIDSSTPANISLSQPVTVMVVAAGRPTPGYTLGLIGGVGGGTGPEFQMSIGDTGSIVFAAGNYPTYTGYGFDQHIVTGIFNGASGSLQRVDGVDLGTANPGTNPWTRPQVGITHQLHDLTFCEMVFYNRVLTTPEIVYNENLLRAKWFRPAGYWTGSPATVTIAGSARTWFNGAAPAFKPTDIETCFSWWDASDASVFSFSSGVIVSQWRDKTTAARHLGVADGSVRPSRTGTINGLNVVTFAGNKWMLIGATPPGADLPPQPNTIFVVCTVDNPVGGAMQGIVGGAGGPQIQRRGDTSALSFDAGVPANYTMSTSPHVITGIFDRLGSRQRIDGLEVGAVNTGPVDFGEFRLGTAAYAGFTMVGTIAEVAIYGRNLNSTEIAQVEGYLIGKWFAPPGPQTWTGSSSAMTHTATSGTWTAAIVTAPGAPTLNTATAGDTTVALAWTAGTTGGSAITDYVIEKSPNGSSSWTTVSESVSTATSYTVTGLTNGAIQYFRVSAVNVAGTGTASNVMSATPVGPPVGSFNFATFPDGAPAGFSTLSGGGDLWIASGVMRVHLGTPYDSYFGKEMYDTPDDNNVHVFEVEASLDGTDNVLVMRVTSTVNESQFVGVQVNGDGSYTTLYEGGGIGSGSWSFPGIGVHFTMKVTSLGSQNYNFSINGGTPVSFTSPFVRTGTYCNVLINNTTKIYKWGFPNGL